MRSVREAGQRAACLNTYLGDLGVGSGSRNLSQALREDQRRSPSIVKEERPSRG